MKRALVKLIDPGLLTSEANFNDDEFFKLLQSRRVIAEVIACLPANTVAGVGGTA
jgi:hypothetical protein